MSTGGVGEVAGPLQERIRAAQAAIAAGYSKLGEMQREMQSGAARDAEAERLQQLEEGLKKMEDGIGVDLPNSEASSCRKNATSSNLVGLAL